MSSDDSSSLATTPKEVERLDELNLFVNAKLQQEDEKAQSFGFASKTDFACWVSLIKQAFELNDTDPYNRIIDLLRNLNNNRRERFGKDVKEITFAQLKILFRRDNSFNWLLHWKES